MTRTRMLLLVAVAVVVGALVVGRRAAIRMTEAFALVTVSPERRALADRWMAQMDSMRTLMAHQERLAALEAAARIPPSDAPSQLSADPEVPPPVRAAVGRALDTELARLGAPPRHPVRVHLVADLPASATFPRVVVLPRRPAEPCVVVVLLQGATVPGGTATVPDGQPLLAHCAFHARYGFPGAGMQRWLDETRGELAASDAPPAREDRPRRGVRILDAVHNPVAGRCGAGDLDACASAWGGAGATPAWGRFGRDSAATSAVRHVVRVASRGEGYPARNLGDLRLALGDAKFAEVWHSDRPPAEAYRALEGRPIGAFARAALLGDAPLHRPGPVRMDLQLLLAVLVVAGSAAVAVRWAAR